MPNHAVIEIEVGKVTSLNMFYASKHWIIRKKAKDKFSAEILDQLNKYDKISFKSITVKVETNLRYDIDNCIMVAKFALDAFKDWGGIPDDTKEFVPKLTMEYNPNLEKIHQKFFTEDLFHKNFMTTIVVFNHKINSNDIITRGQRCLNTIPTGKNFCAKKT